MYQKRLREGGEVYFRHAPPQAFRHETSLEKLPKPPFNGAAPWQCSVYYYWFLFYREFQNRLEVEDIFDPQDGSAQLKSQVSSLFKMNQEVGFLDWWIARGRFLFCEPSTEGVKALTDEEIDHGILRAPFDKARALHDPHIYLKIPVHQDFDKSIEEVRRLLRQAKKIQQQASRFKTKEALLPVFTKPVLSSLEKTYQAWVLRRSSPDLTLADIAVGAGLATRSDNRDVSVRAANASTASRALSQAALLIEWVGRGVFPVTSQSQIKDAEAFATVLNAKLSDPEVANAMFQSAQVKASIAELRKQAAELGLDLKAVR